MGGTGASEGWTLRLVGGCLALSLALLLCLVARADAALYVGTGQINRANLDGSLLELDFVGTGDGSVCAIAVDSSHIYWADSYDNTIGRADLDGANIDDSFIKLADGTLPCGLAVDSKFLYWPNMGTDTIGRARLDGSGVDESFIATAQHPCAVAVNQSAIYWASDDEDEIWRTDIAAVNAPEIVIDEHALDSCGIALEGSHLFWVESDSGKIGRANLDGTDPLPDLISGGGYPVSLVTHGGHLYWVDNARGSVGRAAIDGTDVNHAVIAGLRHPYALAADSVQVHPKPPVLQVGASSLRLGALRRKRQGSVLFPVELYGAGRLEAEVPGAEVRVLPERVAAQGPLSAGRKWLRVSPTTKPGRGSRCVRRALRRGMKVKLDLLLRFTEPGKLPVERRRRFFLFKPHRRGSQASRRRSRVVNCDKRRAAMRRTSAANRRGSSP